MLATEAEWAMLFEDNIIEPIIMKFTKPSEDLTWHLNPLYIRAYINGRLVSHVFIDGKVVLNVILIITLKKLGKSKSDLTSTNMKISNFLEKVIDVIRVLVVNIIVGFKTLNSAFFVVDAKPTYFVLLGRDWVHSS